MSSKSQIQTIRVDVKVELMKFVLGYNQSNLKEIRERFPTLKINNGKHAIYIEGTGTVLLDKCKSVLGDIIIRAMVDKENASYKKRIAKEIESKRCAAAAANRIRDNIENELKSKCRAEITDCLTAKMGIDSQVINSYCGKVPKKIASGMFAGLEIEESDDEISIGNE